MNILGVMSKGVKTLITDACLLGRNIMKLASQCAPPFPIIGRIQGEIAKLVMTLDVTSGGLD